MFQILKRKTRRRPNGKQKAIAWGGENDPAALNLRTFQRLETYTHSAIGHSILENNKKYFKQE